MWNANSWVARYGGALVIIGLATGLRLLLDPLLGVDRFPFITLFFAVLVTAWYGGFGPAAAAVILGALSSAFFLLSPRGLAVQGSEEQMGMLIYASMGMGIAVFGGAMRSAQRRAEGAREGEHAQREQLQVTLKSIGDAVIVTDPAGRVTFLNAVAQSLTGWSQEDAQGKPLETVFKIINEESRLPVENPVSKVLREGKVVGLANHTTLIAKDGSERPIDDSAAPVKDEGTILGVVLVFRDVAERRRLEHLQRDLHLRLEREVEERTAELRASEERFRLLVEGTTDYAIFMLDPRGYIVSWNPGAEQIKGYRTDEIVGRHFSCFYPADDIQDGKPERELRVAAAEGKYEEEGWRLRKDGSPFWASVLITALRDKTGQVQGFSKITKDMTEKKAAEERARALLQEQAARQAAEEGQRQLQEGEQRLRRAEQGSRFLADASKSLAALVDTSSTMQKLARLAVPFFADWCAVDMVQADDLLSRVAVAHVNPSSVGLSPELERLGLRSVLRTGKSQLLATSSDATPLGSVQDADPVRVLRQLGLTSYMCVPLTTRGKTVAAITFVLAESGRQYDAADLALAEDLAHRAAVAMENARLYSEVREADRRKDEFLAMLAHELRNPLAPIRNGLQIMKEAGLDRSAAHELRDMMERQVQHMARMVDDLLDVSRITRGKIELRKEVVDLAAAVNRAVETVSSLIEDRRQQLTVTLPPEPVRLEADPTRLEQILANLLNNAAKYTDHEGEIWLDARVDNGVLVLSVKDTGMGMSADMLSQVFDPFVQADRVLHRSQGGLGIGLTLVRSLVEMHGGSVSAHSPGIGRGSEFVVRLPALSSAERAQSVSVPPASPAGKATPKRRILVVDDNVDAAESLAMLLRLGGHDAKVAHDGPSALAAIDSEPPDIVFLDIGMPVMNGYEVAQQLRRQPGLKNLLLVAMTGWGQEEDRRRSHQAGFDHHLIKPADPATLNQLLAGVAAPEKI